MMLRKLITNCSRNYVSWTTSKKNPSALIKTIVSDYDNYMPKIVNKTLAEATFIESADMRDRIKKEYFTLGRRPVQGELMTLAYETMEKPEEISDKLLHQIQVLVASIELIQTYFFFWDDFADESKTRMGKPCWHVLDNNGALAMNDACIMRSFTEEIVRQNFKGELRDNILNVYSKVYFIASMGQHYDTMASRTRNYDNFTIEQYDILNKMKSAMYATKLPALVALALGNKFNKESIQLIDDFCTDIGILVQIHNDLIDYYNVNGSVTGKSGTDIQEGKCAWPAVAILRKCNPEQRRTFKENYGSWDPAKVSRIRELYEALDLTKLYKEEEKARYDTFNKKISMLPKNSTPSAEFFLSFYYLLSNFTKDTTVLMYDKF